MKMAINECRVANVNAFERFFITDYMIIDTSRSTTSYIMTPPILRTASPMATPRLASSRRYGPLEDSLLTTMALIWFEEG